MQSTQNSSEHCKQRRTWLSDGFSVQKRGNDPANVQRPFATFFRAIEQWLHENYRHWWISIQRGPKPWRRRTNGLSGYHLAGIQYLPHFRWGISRSKGACSESRGTFYSLAAFPFLASDPSKGPQFPEVTKTVYNYFSFPILSHAALAASWNFTLLMHFLAFSSISLDTWYFRLYRKQKRVYHACYISRNTCMVQIWFFKNIMYIKWKHGWKYFNLLS